MIFLSKIRELRLVMKPKWVTKDPSFGVQVHPGHTIEFFEGRYETSDPEEIAFIKSRPTFGSKIVSVERGDLESSSTGKEVITGSVGGGGDSVPKKTFKCLRCGMDGFTSGFEVAEHRKNGECDAVRLSNMEDESPDEKSPELGL